MSEGAIDRKSLVTIDSRVTPMSGLLAPKLCARVTVLFMLTCSMCIDVSVSVLCYFIMLLQHGLSAVSKSKMEKTLRVLKSALERRQFVSWLKMDARQLTKEIRSIAPFLIPFLKMSCVYFILWLPEEQPCVTAAFVKCLPILSLIWFVCLQGVSSGVANSYNRKILTGLVFSCIGDALLIWQENILFFFAGMGNFGIAQIAYTIAFGFTPFGLKELIFSLSGAMVLLSIILPYLSGLLYYCISAYGLLLCLMGWRALARFNLKGEIPWRKIYAACGATLFVASDFAIAFNKFCLPIPGQRSVIMATYYAAQLCISLSVINSRLFFHSTQEECTTCKHSPPKSNSLNHNTAAIH